MFNIIITFPLIAQLTLVISLQLLPRVTAHTANVTCNNRCQLHDTSASCWLKARLYFAQQLTKAVNDYAAIEVMIGQWERTHTVQLNSGIADFTNENFDGPMSDDDMLDIIHVLLNKTSKMSSIVSAIRTPISCPIPCDYVNTLWIYLFVCSCVVVLLAVPVVSLHVYQTHRNRVKYQLNDS